MDLNFDLHNMFASNEMEEFNHFPKMPGSKCGSYTFKPEDLELFDRVRGEFVRRVYQFMQDYQGAKIHSIRVDFLLGDDHSVVIDKWIGFAISKGAQRIELLFSHTTYDVPNLKPYKFPHTVFSEMNYLHLQNCLLLPHTEFSGFKQLKTLMLDELEVEKDLLLCLFSKCSHLEDLTFKLCQFNYGVNIISPALRHLKILFCDLPSKIDIVTSNLLSFECSGNIVSFNSINAPQLAKIYLNPFCSTELVELEIPHAFSQLVCFHKLQNLSMILSPSQVARLPRTIGPFQHLREIELFYSGPNGEDDDYLWVLNIVMACPRLQKLYLGILCPDLFSNQRQIREQPGFTHNELKYVELHGCVGQMNEIELAIHFLKNVISLEQITFSPRARYHRGGGEWFDGFDCPNWFETGRNLICEKLQDHVNGQTRLIFLED